MSIYISCYFQHVLCDMFDANEINPLRAKFLGENINIYLHFISFLYIDKTQVVQIPPRVRQGPVYST